MNLNPMYLESFHDSPNAKEFFILGYESQLSGNLLESIQYYRKSISLKHTAECYTFLGWTFSLLSKVNSAIKFCKKAILTDPTLGNPYNDIGVYLMEQKKFYAAIPWFQKAKESKRYECRFYPYFNLGRVYELTGHFELARLEYEQASKIEPRFDFTSIALKRIQSIYN